MSPNNLEYIKLWHRRRKEKRVSLGLCVTCGNPLKESEKYRCSICVIKSNEFRNKRTSLGLCSRCGKNPITTGMKNTCSFCRSKGRNVRNIKVKNYKKIAVTQLGGSCKLCGLRTDILDVYDFHHINPKEKDFSISANIFRGCGWERIKKEVAKCILLCANCHRVLHYHERRKKDAF